MDVDARMARMARDITAARHVLGAGPRAAALDLVSALGARLLDRSGPVHVTTSALVFAGPGGRDVLLVAHGQSRRWQQLGGHWEPGVDADTAGAALREATEESGLTGLSAGAAPLAVAVLDPAVCGRSGGAVHLDVAWSFAGPGSCPLPDVLSPAAWHPADRLPADVDGYTRDLVMLGRRGPGAGGRPGPVRGT